MRSFFRNKRFKFHIINLGFVLPLFYKKKTLFLEEEELQIKDIIQGEYLNRIRIFAKPEKKFTIFAQLNSSSDPVMTYFQLLDSLTPFPYTKILSIPEIEKMLLNNKMFNEVVKKIDLNNDGVINFDEYLVLTAFLSSKFMC
jgi:hypothetical protein